jgi:hypothetical protein
MRRSHVTSIVLALAAALVAAFAPFGAATPLRAQACNLRGSWVANNAETQRYVQAINPTTGNIEVTSGALSATFDHGRFHFGSLGLHLVGTKGQTTIKEEIDIEASAPYHVVGRNLALGAGTFKLTYIDVILITHGRQAIVHLPNQSTATPRQTLAYSCTPSALHLHVAAGAAGVTLTLHRERS